MADPQHIADLDAQIDSLERQIHQARRALAEARASGQEDLIEGLTETLAILEREIDRLHVTRTRLLRRPGRKRSDQG